MSERLYRVAFEALPGPVLLLEEATGKVLAANRAFLSLIGREAADVVGATPPYAWSDGTGASPVVEAGEDAFVRVTGLYQRADGTQVPVQSVRETVADSETGERLCVAWVTDLTERDKLEQQLVQSGRSAAVGQLAAGVAHEINNPLLVILGMTEFLLMEAEPGTKQRERLELIQQTGLEIRDIVRGLVEFAREPADLRSELPLEDLVRSTLVLARRANLAKLVEIVERYPAERLVVVGSTNQLKQVFLNLLSNAQAATASGGTVVFELSRDDDRAVVTVTDDGVGIAEDVLPHVFEPFYTTRRDAGAAGLGLTVSRRIAELHGGTLEISSTPGRGTICRVRLPLVVGGS